MRAEAALLALALACGGRAADALLPVDEEPPVNDCTATVSPGDDLAAAVTDGAVLCLKAGVHRANLDLQVSVTLRGEPGAILDGGGSGPVVRIGVHGKRVVLEGLEIRGGAYELGSGVLVEGYSEVGLSGCRIAGNQRGPGGGNGLAARRGTVLVQATSFGETDEVVFTTTAQGAFDRVTAPGVLIARDGAQVAIKDGQLGTLRLRGTSTRAPSVTLSGAEIGQVDNDGPYPGTVTRQ